jgi:Ca-activated chloride channel homolog
MAYRRPPKKSLCLFSVLACLFCATLVSAQTNLDDVHITPAKSKPTNDQFGLIPSAPLLKKNVDLVMVPVTITDDRNRIITGLTLNNFQLFDGKQKQEIKHFSSEDAPISMGIILDTSGSMDQKMAVARKAVMEFCQAANPQDEFFMVTFGNQPELATDFTNSMEKLEHSLLFAKANGRTALLDAVSLSLHQMRHAQYQRRALLIISDGGDNHSRYTESEVRSMVKEADVQIYAIGIFDRNTEVPEEIAGPVLLEEISRITGGRGFAIENPDLLPAVALHIGSVLRNQYVLAYRPERTPKNGKWHKINIKLTIPKSIWPVSIRAKQGYYAPTE